MEHELKELDRNIRFQDDQHQNKNEQLKYLLQSIGEKEAEQKRGEQMKMELNMEFDKYERDTQDQEKQKQRMDEEEASLASQMEYLTRHSELLEKQNQELGSELQTMVETDELIRQRLNRRDRVVELRERNEVQIGRSK